MLHCPKRRTGSLAAVGVPSGCRAGAGRRRGVRVRIASSVPAAVANCSERERPDTAQAAGPRRALPAQGLLQRLRALNGT